MTVHVSIHDVSPRWESEIETALEMCHAVDVKPALLVVPNFHGKAPLADAPAFAEKLRALQAGGHEIILHGFFHQSRGDDVSVEGEGRPTGFRRMWAQNVASGGEAEFSDVTIEEARARLADGERVLEDAGLRAVGFIPPAWSMPPWLLPMLAERGYRFTEDHLFAYDPQGKKRRASVVLNYASRTPSKLFSSVAWCRIARHARAALPARIAIHPADMKFHLLRGEVEKLLAWGKGDFVETTQALF